MAVSLAQGVPTFTGITIPVLYPKKLLAKMYAKTVIANICSTDHESELKKQGDVARIRLEPTVTRKTGIVGQDMVPERPAFSYVDLTIDKLFYFDEAVDDVIAQQSDIEISKAYENAITSQNAVDTDADVLAYMDTLGDAENIGSTAGIKTGAYDLGTTGSSIPITTLNAVDKLADLLYTLREQNVTDKANMWQLIPEWYTRKLVTSELKVANEMGDAKSTLRTGLVGELFGVPLFDTNNMTATTDGTDSSTCWYAHAGHKSAVAFAQTISNMRVVQMENQFAKRIQLQVVYGRKVVQDDYLASLYCRPAAE